MPTGKIWIRNPVLLRVLPANWKFSLHSSMLFAMMALGGVIVMEKKVSPGDGGDGRDRPRL